MSNILTNVTSVVTSAIGWMTAFVTAITSTGNEILLLFAIVPLVGLGIGLLKRMINVN